MSVCDFIQVFLIVISKESALCKVSLMYLKLHKFPLVKFVRAEVLSIYIVIAIILIVVWVEYYCTAF